MKPAVLTGCLLILLTGHGHSVAQQPATQLPATQADTESRLQEVNRAIGELQQSLEASRQDHAREMARLKELDLEIQSNAVKLRDLETQRQAQHGELARLDGQREQFLINLERNRQQLAEQIRAAWMLGRQSRVKLVLNQDSPARLNRTLAYYDYFSQAQSARINELKSTLAGLDTIGEAIESELQSLNNIEEQHTTTESRLQEQRNERVQLLAALDEKIDTGQTSLEELQRNRADLEKVLAQLSNALADIPANLGDRLHPGSLKGQLPMPLQGRVLHAYGQQRGAGLNWQGWVIATGRGAEVQTIAYGRVAYADWLRGYGLLLIIDHGDGFMSLYGNNESLLSELGDWVEAGQAIATAGSATADAQGLYFELRNNGKAVDPAVWINRR